MSDFQRVLCFGALLYFALVAPWFLLLLPLMALLGLALAHGLAGLVVAWLWLASHPVPASDPWLLPRRWRGPWSGLHADHRWYLLWAIGLLGFVVLSVSAHLLLPR